MKTCRTCKTEKTADEFYRDSRSKDGLYSSCKPCHKGMRGPSTNTREQRDARYQRTKVQLLKYQKIRRVKAPWETPAGNAVRTARKKGLLTPEPCENCGREKVVAHHDDYNFFLKVRWLCQSCHRKWHLTNKPIYPTP